MFTIPSSGPSPRASPLLYPPAPLRDALRYAGPLDGGHVFLTASGRDRTVILLDPKTGGRIESAPLGPDEDFFGPGPYRRRAPVLARGRLFAASDRYLYGFDPARDLYIEAAIPPPVDRATGLYESGPDFFGNLLAAPKALLSATSRALVLFREPRG
jgi:hypothetical protein